MNIYFLFQLFVVNLVNKIWWYVFMKNIIIVDMQKGFINKNNKHLVNKINNYLNESKFNNIFYTKFYNNDNSPFFNILKWNGMMSLEDLEFVVKINPMCEILEKNTYGLNMEQINFLKELNINEVEICGTDTDACVLTIAYQLFDNNIKPIILSDLCASSSKDKNIHYNALQIMRRSFGNDCIK